MTREREELIRAAWEERGKALWDPEINERDLVPLMVQTTIELNPVSPHPGTALPLQTMLEFRFESAGVSGRPYHAIVCEGVVVDKIEQY
jgi:hypothetical protein